MNVISYRTSAKGLWGVLFQLEGNVFFAVLPFCVVNCLLLALVEKFEEDDDFGFSPNGHGLMTLLVSFLVISKVNLAFDRFRGARHYTGNAFLHLRELTQLVITVSSGFKDDDKSIQRWRSTCIDRIVELLDCTRRVVQDEKVAAYLARNQGDQVFRGTGEVDPLVLVQAIRLHVYLTEDLQLLERVNVMSKLNEFVTDYRHLLDIASTPLPFPLIQMGRAFLFLWTFTMPLVLRQGPFTDLWTAMVFLFFLTYGFVGLELVAMKLASPFGDETTGADIQVTALRDAAMVGIENDLRTAGSHIGGTASQRRLTFRNSKTSGSDANYEPTGSRDQNDAAVYHAMAAGSDGDVV